MTVSNSYHTPVMLHQVIEQMNINPSGVYVDCTFCGGGHAKAILEKLNSNGKLIVFDQDEDAVKNIPDDVRIEFVHQNFRHIKRFLRLKNVQQVDGVLADLGVSSFQFDEATKGFSYRFDGMMDMRMDKRQEKTAASILATYSQLALHKMFEKNGEVVNAKTLATALVEYREQREIKLVNDFMAATKTLVRGNPNQYYAKVFQALRIEVNDELGALKDLLLQVPEVLVQGGRVAIITFHSIEDRIVKNYFKKGIFENEEVDKNPFIMEKKELFLKTVFTKPIVASDTEVKENPRSRSAKLRVAERINN